MLNAPNRPRLVIIAHDIHDHGGMERVFAEMIRRLHTEYEIVVVSATLDESLRRLVEWRRVPTPRKPFPLKFLWFFAAGGIRALSVRANLVHVLGAIVPIRADVACIAFCHAGFLEASGGLTTPGVVSLRRANAAISHWLALQAERWCYRPDRLRVFGAVSGGVARELRRHYPGVPVFLTPNGVDVERYRPDETVRQARREAEGVHEDEMVTLFVGGDWERKGLKFAIEALALVRQDGIAAVLWIVGPGRERTLKGIAEELGVLEYVTFFGRQSGTEPYFQAADVLVLPTSYETFSLVAYEAAAAHLPIVATAVSGIDELLKDGVGGLVVDRSPDRIAEALKTLWGDRALRLRLADSGFQRARDYSWDRAAAAVRDLYSKMLPLEDEFETGRRSHRRRTRLDREPTNL